MMGLMRGVVLVWLVVAVAACGRSGFDELDASSSGDGAGGGGGDGAIDPIDAPAGATVATFGETPGATHSGVTSDTYLDSESGTSNNNYGAGTSLTAEGSQKRILLRFDTSAIAAGTHVDGARLHLYLSYAEGTCMVSIAQITEAWTEGTMSGTAGVANWTQRTATQSWTTAGASSPGSATGTIASLESATAGLLGVDLPAATLQGWVDAPATNFGLVLSASGGGECRFDSSASATPANRPELVATYTTP